MATSQISTAKQKNSKRGKDLGLLDLDLIFVQWNLDLTKNPDLRKIVTTYNQFFSTVHSRFKKDFGSEQNLS